MLAKLNALELPIQFKYVPLTTRKRRSAIATAGGVVHQFASPAMQLDGDSEVSFSIESATGEEADALAAIYNLPNSTIVHTFLGSNGVNYSVLFNNFEIERQGWCLYRLTGSFTVLCVNNSATFDCCVASGR